MRPPRRINTGGCAKVDLVMLLKALRAHVAPPVEIRRLPVLERAQQPLVAGEVDVVGNAIVQVHRSLTAVQSSKFKVQKHLVNLRCANHQRTAKRSAAGTSEAFAKTF